MVHWRMAKAAVCWCSGSLKLFCKSFWFRKYKTYLLQTFLSSIFNHIYIAKKCTPCVCFYSFILTLSKWKLIFIWCSTLFFSYNEITYLVTRQAFMLLILLVTGSLKWPPSWHGQLAMQWIPLSPQWQTQWAANGFQLILLIRETWQTEEQGEKRLKDLRYPQVHSSLILHLRKLSPRGEKFFA